MNSPDPPAIALWRRRLYLVPLVLMFLAAWPSINYQLPACQSDLGEDYQPLDTLRFFHSRGRAFQRYGVFPNFVLAPGYGVSLAWWHMTGQWQRGGDDFPYGFTRPMEQMGFLLWQGRWIFLTLGLAGLAYHLRVLRQWLPSPEATFVAYLACLATNPILGLHLANTRPDGIALCLTAVALAIYHQMVVDGMTASRACRFSMFAVAALSSKELAAFMFVLPCAILSVRQCVRAYRTRDGVRSNDVNKASLWPVCVLLLTGIGSYALLNVVYAPSAWWERMRYWLEQGADKDVFATTATAGLDAWLFFGQRAFASMANNLGPGGVPVVIFGLLIAAWRRPSFLIFLSLPLLSVLVLFLIPLGYAQDRYYLYVALGLVAPVAIGWNSLLVSCVRRSFQITVASGLCICFLANLSYLTFAWVALPMRAPYLMEHDVQNRIAKDEPVYVLTYDPGPQSPGKHRLVRLGYSWDARALQEIMQADPESRPEWIYAHAGAEAFIDGAPSRPARAAYLRAMSQFDCQEWRGVVLLGYHVAGKLQPEPPAWFLWRRMPAVRELEKLEQVTVYKRD